MFWFVIFLIFSGSLGGLFFLWQRQWLETQFQGEHKLLSDKLKLLSARYPQLLKSDGEAYVFFSRMIEGPLVRQERYVQFLYAVEYFETFDAQLRDNIINLISEREQLEIRRSAYHSFTGFLHYVASKFRSFSPDYSMLYSSYDQVLIARTQLG